MSHLHFTEDKRENLASGDASHGPSGAVRTPQRQITSRRDQSEASVQGLVDRFTDVKAGEDENILFAMETRKQKAVWIHENTRWEKQCDIPTEFPEEWMSFCKVTGGIIALGGDINFHHKSSICYYYSFSEHCWQKLPDMRTARAGALCAEIKNMVVMVVGGLGNKEEWSVECEILDIKRNQWFPAASLPVFLFEARICVVAGRTFIYGFNNHENARVLFEYDPKSDKFSKKAPLPRLRHIDSLAALENKMYGITDDVQSVIQYDSATDQWTRISAPRKTHLDCAGIIATARGKNILLCGGNTDECRIKTIEEFNTLTHQWRMLDIRLPFQYCVSTSFVTSVSV